MNEIIRKNTLHLAFGRINPTFPLVIPFFVKKNTSIVLTAVLMYLYLHSRIFGFVKRLQTIGRLFSISDLKLYSNFVTRRLVSLEIYFKVVYSRSASLIYLIRRSCFFKNIYPRKVNFFLAN